MKKVLFAALVLSMSLVTLSGCSHEHTWKEATCTTAKICTECGETEGKALGHTWKDATCTEPKTCTKCGATEGKAADHKWQAATCTKAKTCSKCGKTEGKALGHTKEIGVCERCGNISNKELVTEIDNAYNYVKKNFESISSYVKKLDGYGSNYSNYSYLKIIQSYVEDNKPYLKKMYELCGDYSELSWFKKKVEIEYNAVPTGIGSSNTYVITTYLKDLSAYISASTDALQEYNSFLESAGLKDLFNKTGSYSYDKNI